ncbi:prophage antirepressor [Desulfobulbus propionicus DSM 2032]|uniref:Prophage antirepressor n=1 Tax=Desulfobulbus propionicus (strain ATCC 33891 / DSM 2032 / VKM B-1956 / 1pr3) TaxID=577650 RepID=A0A7U3YJ82_DESPD|nr:Bro-N domain-containing protein [Desulfobulbus propionicus]ADW16400.1 prophage antirepressor [Desulfobulbus propionicus DSM 2032]
MSSPASSPSAVIPFQFESNEIRALTIDGDPWFVARDVCDVLEYADASDATQFLDDDEKLVRQIAGAGQTRNMLIISESGLYTLIIRSNKPQAKPFRKWVTAEVLPSIRKTGGYALPNQGKRADIFHHRGPVSDSGLDIRYTLDLTKILTRPTRTSLTLLQRLTGIEMDDLVEDALHITPGREVETSLDGFLNDCTRAVPDPAPRLTLAEMHRAYRQWCLDHGLNQVNIATSRELAARLRDLGYTLAKVGGRIQVFGLTVREVA